VCLFFMQCHLDLVPDSSAVSLRNGFTVAIGEVYIIPIVIKPVHFAAFVLKEIIYAISSIVGRRLAVDRPLVIAGSEQ